MSSFKKAKRRRIQRQQISIAMTAGCTKHPFTHDQAASVARRKGHRAYQCELCRNSIWHVTSKQEWRTT